MTRLVGDALALPLLDDSVDAAVMGFLLNQLSRPADALREAARVVRPGGWVLASTWARSDAHPVRQIVQQVLVNRGWRIPAWYQVLKETTTPLSDTAEALRRLAWDAGLAEVDAAQVEVPVRVSPRELMEWRLGMPHVAPFVAALPPAELVRLRRELQTATAAQPPLVCTVVLLVSRVP